MHDLLSLTAAGPLTGTYEVRGTRMSANQVSANTSTGRLNKPSLAAIVLAVLAVGGMWFAGFVMLAIFAVGAGHVALQQISSNSQRERWQAIAPLVLGYGVGVLAVISYLGVLHALST